MKECKRRLIKIDNLFSTPINFIPFINLALMERHFWQMRIGGGGGGSGSAHKIRHTIQTIGVSLCHRISCLTKIYLLSITSRNTEVDLNYRSLVLWQRFAIFASLRIERRKKWKKNCSRQELILALKLYERKWRVIKKCLWKIACCWEKVL